MTLPLSSWWLGKRWDGEGLAPTDPPLLGTTPLDHRMVGAYNYECQEGRMRKQTGKKKEGVPNDPWENTVWIDDMLVTVTKKKGKGRGVLTNRKKLIKFFE